MIPLRNSQIFFINAIRAREINRTNANILNLDDRDSTVAKLAAFESVA